MSVVFDACGRIWMRKIWHAIMHSDRSDRMHGPLGTKMRLPFSTHDGGFPGRPGRV